MTLNDVDIDRLRSIVNNESFISFYLNSFYEVKNQWLEYQGQRLNWYSGSYPFKSVLKATYKATSGLLIKNEYNYLDYRNAKYEKYKDKGPVPHGKYWIALLPNPNRIAKADRNSGEILE